MRFDVTKQEFLFEDDSGYRFNVVCERFPREGWTATVKIAADGRVSANAAVDALRPAVEELLRQLETHAKGAK